MANRKRYSTFKAFYPFYLSQHQHPFCRYMHYFGSMAAAIVFLYALTSQQYSYCWLAIICGYFFAWLGHLIFEKNRPATFIYPWFSFVGDWYMLKDALKTLLRSTKV